ncbi:M56 family metallopeptidase [Winogradskyella maritima]|uniref:M56 family metallopeptidase n=1 Tax=Winogradskyella maritima TaxID=1517766 RepID=A0ABV8ANF6_9FLAO|nr:M56 family metallopeptidase [Winogradskyella maritima]
MDYLLKASVVALIFYVCYLLFLKRETFFQHNRWFLLAGIVTALVFPLIVIPNYIEVTPVAVEATSFTMYESSNESIGVLANVETPFDWSNLLLAIYLVGLAFFLIRFLLQFGSLIQLLLNNPKNKSGFFTYIIVKSDISPFSFFKWIVYNPELFDDNELQLILNHERVHAREYHSLDILFTNLACAVFWFNPVIWLYKKDLQQNLEYIADHKAQQYSENEKDYQHLLLKTSVAHQNLSLTTNFYNSLIKNRILMLHKSKSKNYQKWKFLSVLPLLAFFLMSANIKDIYVEVPNTETYTAVYNDIPERLEFVVTKNTTEDELNELVAIAKKNGVTLQYDYITRNDKNELTNLNLKLNGRSYGGGTGTEPIESFIIYKELDEAGGAYVGRLEGATLHFDDKENLDSNDDKRIESLRQRASNAIVRLGIQDVADAKHRTLMFPKKSEVDPIKVTFNKSMTDAQLEAHKKELKSEGISMSIDRVKRNADGDITSIKLSFTSDTSSVNYAITDDEDGIDPFTFESNKDGGLSVKSTKSNTFEMHFDDEDHDDAPRIIHDDDDNVFIIKRSKEDTLKMNGRVKINTVGKNMIITEADTIMMGNNQGKVKWVSRQDQNGEYHINNDPKFIVRSGGSEPLYIVDGKIIKKKDLKDIDHMLIDHVNVIKDKKATEKYGVKAKNGVVEIFTKDHHPERQVIKIHADDQHKMKKIVTRNHNNTIITAYAHYDEGTLYHNEEEHIAEITKYTSDDVLDDYKAYLKKEGIHMKYSKLKRNNNGEITRIKISVKNDKGASSSASYNDDDGIRNISVGQKGESLIVTTSRI